MQMRQKFEVEGQSPALEDIAQLADAAALADDRVFETLFQIPPYGTGFGGKYILPLYTAGLTLNEGLVLPSGFADGSVRVGPFRALMGATPSDAPNVVWQDTRSAVFAGTSSLPFQAVPLQPTISGNRWDLIYVRMDRDVAQPAVIRAVKATDGSVSGQMISVQDQCVLALNVVQGTEGVAAQPSLPADTATTVNIPLAYVQLTHPHTLATVLTGRQVLEVAPRISISPRTGAITMRPASAQYTAGQAILASATAGIGVTGVVRPPAFLPAGMSGIHGRTIALGFNGSTTGRSIPIGQVSILDDSIDWRNRIFYSLWHATVGTGTFAWDDAAGFTPNPFTTSGLTSKEGITQTSCWGHSFHPDSSWNSVDGIANAGPVAVLSHGNISSIVGSGTLSFYVNMGDGSFRVKVGASDPGVMVVGWVFASGPQPNVGF